MAKHIKTVEKEITTKIVDSLEQAIQSGREAQWQMPWVSKGSGMPVSFSSGKPYRGGNLLILLMAQVENGFASNRWITKKQMLQAGGRIPKEDFPNNQYCYFFKEMEVTDEKTGNIKKRWFAKTYQVWNLAQTNISIENPEKEQKTEAEFGELDQFLNDNTADVRFGQSKAYYHPRQDFIGLPNPEDFQSEGDYLATKSHELVHWTGHDSRQKRDLQAKGTEAYAFEELIAELGSSFISAEYDLPHKVQDGHEEYLLHWVKALSSDTSLVFKAAKKASEAVAYLKKDAGLVQQPQGFEPKAIAA